MQPSPTADQLGRRAPPDVWEAYFLIGIFPAGSPLAWCKFHLFSGGARAGRHCLSAVEALDGPGQKVFLLGSPERVERRESPLEASAFVRARDRWELAAPGVTWSGDLGGLTLDDRDMGVHATARARDLLWWVRIPRVLSYFSAFGELHFEGPRGVATGLGLVEHAWGGDTRVDLLRHGPRRWHWDVLSTGDNAGCAGLAVGFGGALRGVRTGGRVPGSRFSTGRSMRVDVAAWTEEEGRRVPARWSGRIQVGEGVLRYEARAATKVAPMVPGGGFLGTTYEGEWRPNRGSAEPVHGTGFTEYRAA